MNPREAAKDLKTPAGIDAKELEGVITNITARRKEMLDRLKEDPGEFPVLPPEKASQPDDRNRVSYEEQWILQKELTEGEYPPGPDSE